MPELMDIINKYNSWLMYATKDDLTSAVEPSLDISLLLFKVLLNMADGD